MRRSRIQKVASLATPLVLYGCGGFGETVSESTPNTKLGATSAAIQGENLPSCTSANSATWSAGVLTINAQNSISHSVVITPQAGSDPGIEINGYVCQNAISNSPTPILLSQIVSVQVFGGAGASDVFVLDFSATLPTGALASANSIVINGGENVASTTPDTLSILLGSTADTVSVGQSTSYASDSSLFMSTSNAALTSRIPNVLIENLGNTTPGSPDAPLLALTLGSGNDTFTAMGGFPENGETAAPISFGITVMGGPGDDLITGGLGNDQINGGGNLNDTVSYSGLSRPVYVDMDSTLVTLWGANLWGVTMHYETLIVDLGDGNRQTVQFGTESTPTDIVTTFNSQLVDGSAILGPWATLVGNRLRLVGGSDCSYVAIESGSTAAPKLGLGTGLFSNLGNDGQAGVQSNPVAGTSGGPLAWNNGQAYTAGQTVSNGGYWYLSTSNAIAGASPATAPSNTSIGRENVHDSAGNGAWTVEGRIWSSNSSFFNIGDVVPGNGVGITESFWQVTGLQTSTTGGVATTWPTAPTVFDFASPSSSVSTSKAVDGDNTNVLWACNTVVPVWGANTVVPAGAYVASVSSPVTVSSIAVAAGGTTSVAGNAAYYVYRAVRPGKTGAAEPTWANAWNVHGAVVNVSDGTALWTPVPSYSFASNLINQGTTIGVAAAANESGCLYTAVLSNAETGSSGANTWTGTAVVDGTTSSSSVAYLWTYVGTLAEMDDIQGVANIIGGFGDDTLMGNSKPNILTGGEGNDILCGGPPQNVTSNNSCGNTPDTLIGGNGDDWFDMGGDDNTFEGLGVSASSKLAWYDCNQNVVGGNGTDVVDYSKRSSVSQIKVTLNGSMKGGDQNQSGADEADIIASDVEIVLGGSGNDTITGGNNPDVLFGGPGADAIYGGGGNDFIWGGSGNDRLYGDTGDDTFYEMTAYQSPNAYDDPLGSQGVLASNFAGIGLMIYGAGSSFFGSDTPGGGDDQILGGTTPATENDHLDLSVTTNPTAVILCTANSLSDTSWATCNMSASGYIYLSCDGSLANTHAPGDGVAGCDNNYVNIEYVSGSFTQTNVIVGTSVNVEQLEGGQDRDFIAGEGPASDGVYGYGSNPGNLTALPVEDSLSADVLCGGGSSYVWGGPASFEEGDGLLTLTGNGTTFVWNGTSVATLASNAGTGVGSCYNSARTGMASSGGASVCVGGGTYADCYP